MSDDKDPPAGYASPPCLAEEIAPEYFDPLHVSADQARDVARWRRAERTRLRAERQTLSVDDRADIGRALMRHLRDVLAARFPAVAEDRKGGGQSHGQGRVLSGYWPIKGEPDLRPLLTELHDAGQVICLPIVETKAAPLVFRRWTPDTRMVRGDWNIPVPPPEAQRLVPDIMLAPLMGWDARGFRLGYGGGYFDRTLAACDPRPFTIGIGLQSAELATIYPQPHDIPLDLILTEAGVQTPGDPK